MPRKTRKTSQISNESKENIILNEVTRRSTRKKRGIFETSESEESFSSPSKISRASSSSLSPLGEQFKSKLNVSETNTKYRSVRRALVGNSEFRLPGREKEFEELSSFFNELITNEGSGSLYVSGAPGNYSIE